MRTRAASTRCLAAVVAVCTAVVVSACGGSPQQKAAQFMTSGIRLAEEKDHARAVLQFRNAAKAIPEDAEPWYRMGLSSLHMNDAAGALASLQKAVQLNSRHIGAQVSLSELMIASRVQNVMEDALERMGRALVLNPDHPDLLRTKAAAEIGLGRLDDAEQTLQRALEKSPGSPTFALMQALVRLGRKDVDGAANVLKDACSRNPRSSGAAVALGKLYMLQGNPTEAEVQFRRALAIDGENAQALLELGAMQLHGNRIAEAGETYSRLAALPESQYKLFHALFLMQTGQAQKATSELERLLEADSQDRSVRTRLVRSYMDAGRTAEAEGLLEKALEMNPRDADSRLLRAELLLAKGESGKAQDDILAVMKYRPESAEARYLQARIHRQNGAMTKDRQNLTDALRLHPGLLQARVELAQISLASGNAQGALDLIDAAPQAQRRSIPAVIQRNWAFIALGRFREARAGVDEALKQGTVPDLLLQDGVLKLRQNSYTAAKNSLEAVLKDNPADVRALDALANAYTAEKQPDAALRRVRQQAELQPASAAIQHYYGVLLARYGDKDGSRAAFRRATSLDPRLAAARLDLARLELAEGRAAAARESLLALLRQQPGHAEGALMLAMLEEKAGNREQASEYYRQIIADDDRSVVAFNNLAYLLSQDNAQLDEALKYAQHAREIAPDTMSPVDHTLGWIYYRKGIYRTAIKYLEAAVSRHATPLRRYHLAMAYLKAGEIGKGQEELRSAVRMDSTLPEAKETERLLNQVVAATTRH